MANIVYTCIELCTALASAIPITQASPLAAASSSMSCLRKAGSVKGSAPQPSVALSASHRPQRRGLGARCLARISGFVSDKVSWALKRGQS